MNSAPNSLETVSTSLRADHRLFVQQIELLGGFRTVNMSAGLNVVRGDITTGKTTFVRLMKSLLSTVSSTLPPETANVRAILGTLQLRYRGWRMYRPLVTTANAPIEVAIIDDDDDDAFTIRLRAKGAEGSVSRFMLDQLGLPNVVVPEGSTSSTARMNPVSITDWLGYCIVTGDEIDSEVFGHRDPFRDRKRRTVFELIYGYYDTELSDLHAQRRSLELKLGFFDQEDDVIGRFLSGTPFSDAAALAVELTLREDELQRIDFGQITLARQAGEIGAGEVGLLRRRVLDLRDERDMLEAARVNLRGQIADLDELSRQLRSQSSRLTRAIVSEEWLVDFDFIVCPRCGSDVEPVHSPNGNCYLCHEKEKPGKSQDVLLAEQQRVVSQIDETKDLVEGRKVDLRQVEEKIDVIDVSMRELSEHLDRVTETFISDQAALLQNYASERARLEAEIAKLHEYDALLARREDREETRAELENTLEDILLRIDAHASVIQNAELNRDALEQRFFEYVKRLNIPQLEETLTVRINPKTYMPEVSGRSFDELSSQGLKTLVNAAHALAHHTVAIDRGLPLPGLLVLDGLSANYGHQGFDQARVDDLYGLIISVASEYAHSLQLVIVDNELPPNLLSELERFVVLDLNQDDRLIRLSGTESP